MQSTLDFNQAVLVRQVDSARAMFQRVLVCWAGDVLELRRRDLIVPRWVSTPADAECQDNDDGMPMKRVA
jgi:hypothetical protein